MSNSKPQVENIPMELLYPLFADMLKGGSVTFTVTGISMQPMLYNRRDSVTIVPPPKHLKKGDIPFFKTDDGKFILHRVIRIHPDGTYECRGDNRTESEDNIRHEQIIGVISEFTRNGKKHSVKEPLYRLYVFTWPFFHRFKKYYRHLRTAERKIKEFGGFLKYLIKPKKERVKLTDGSMKEIKYRRAITADIPEIQKLCAELVVYEEESFGIKTANKFWYLEEDGKKLFQKYIDNYFLYIAVCEGKIIGYIRGDVSKHLSRRYPVGILQNIYIEEKYRGLGIGSEFMREFKAYCLENDCREIDVTFKEDNLRAEGFYKSKGFSKMTKTYRCEL